MKENISKQKAQKEIENFIKKEHFSKDELKKIKKIARRGKVKLKELRKRYCKKCESILKGKLRIKNQHKITECSRCKYKNKEKIKIN
jgi:RNase P subunit RPR2